MGDLLYGDFKYIIREVSMRKIMKRVNCMIYPLLILHFLFLVQSSLMSQTSTGRENDAVTIRTKLLTISFKHGPGPEGTYSPKTIKTKLLTVSFKYVQDQGGTFTPKTIRTKLLTISFKETGNADSKKKK